MRVTGSCASSSRTVRSLVPRKHLLGQPSHRRSFARPRNRHAAGALRGLAPGGQPLPALNGSGSALRLAPPCAPARPLRELPCAQRVGRQAQDSFVAWDFLILEHDTFSATRRPFASSWNWLGCPGTDLQIEDLELIMGVVCLPVPCVSVWAEGNLTRRKNRRRVM